MWNHHLYVEFLIIHCITPTKIQHYCFSLLKLKCVYYDCWQFSVKSRNRFTNKYIHVLPLCFHSFSHNSRKNDDPNTQERNNQSRFNVLTRPLAVRGSDIKSRRLCLLHGFVPTSSASLINQTSSLPVMFLTPQFASRRSRS